MSYPPPPPGPNPHQGVQTHPAPRRVPGTRMLIAGIIMLVVSIIGGLIAVMAFGASMVTNFVQFGESTHQIDEHVRVDGLGDDRWYLYQDPPSATSTCAVFDAQGNDIVERSGDMAFSTTELSLVAAQSFESTADGVYEIECSAYPVMLGGAVPLGGLLGLVFTGVVAILVGIAGLVLTIIGAVRRSRAQRNAVPPGREQYAPPPPPQQTGQYPPTT